MDVDDDVFEILNGESKYGISDKLDIGVSTAEKLKWFTINNPSSNITNMDDDEVDDTVTKMMTSQNKSKQRLMDHLRITRKHIRDNVRFDNAIEEHGHAIRKILETNPPAKWKRELGLPITPTGAVGVIQLSDLHLNELVEMECNHFDFNVASQRLQYLAKRAKRRFKDENVEKVVIIMTADMINSDRRIDELLSMATNRSKAEILTCMILEQFILDIATDFEVECTSVTGNESRKRDDRGFVDMVATDNYDWTIHQILKLLFRNNDRVSFFDFESSREGVVNINGHNLLVIHGDTIGRSGIHKQISQIKAKVASKCGLIIDYVIFGHIHSAYCSDLFSRSGSLVGANPYSDDALNLESRASQNIYIFAKNYIEPTVIDLQHPVGVAGYNVDESLEAYNVKSATKAKKFKTRIAFSEGII